MKNLVSIIVPIYNVEKYLRRCIESIVSQTYKNIEILLVNDGSPDNSYLICEEFANKDNRVKVLNKTNGGLSDARNYGIDNCNGEYICFVDSDDYIENDYVEKMYDKMVSNNVDLVVCNYDLVYENSLEKKNNCCYNPNMIISKESAINSIFKNYDWQLEVAWSKMYNAKLFDNIRFTKGLIHEDIDTTYRIVDNCNKIYVMEDILYHYVQRDNSIMHSRSATKEYPLIEIQKRRFDYLNEKKYSKSILGMSYFMYLFDIIKIANMYKQEANKEKKEELLCLFKKEYSNTYKKNLSLKQKLKLKIKYFTINR